MKNDSTIVSPGGCLMALLPMTVTLGSLWWSGSHRILCWSIFIAAAFHWWTAEAAVRSKNEAENCITEGKSILEFEEKQKVHSFWARAYGIFSFVFFIFCLAVIIFAFTHQSPP